MYVGSKLRATAKGRDLMIGSEQSELNRGLVD